MMQRPECQKYKLWKKAQNAKNAGPKKKKVKKKRKKKGPIDDCLEGDNDEEKEKKAAPLHIDYEKCKEQQKKRRRRERAALAKTIPILKRMEDKIQPPIPVREQYLQQRHIPCMLERTPSINLNPKTAIYSVPKKRARQRDASKGGRAKDDGKDAKEDASSSQQQNTTETEAGGTTGGESDAEGKKKKKKRKKKLWVEMPYQRTIETDCDSICSFDSDICLAGLTLTAEDKKELEKFQKRDGK